MFSRRLLLRFINGNKCEKKTCLKETAFGKRQASLLRPPPPRYIFSVLKEAIKSIQTGRRDIFRFFSAV